jgi:hypothetical protein
MTQRPNAKRKTRSHERLMWFIYVLKDNGNISGRQFIAGNSFGHALQKLAAALPDKVSEIQVWRTLDDPIRTATVHRIGKRQVDERGNRRRQGRGAR